MMRMMMTMRVWLMLLGLVILLGGCEGGVRRNVMIEKKKDYYDGNRV